MFTHATVAQNGESAVKRMPVASTGSRSTEKNVKYLIMVKLHQRKCVGKRVILIAMLKK